MPTDVLRRTVAQLFMVPVAGPELDARSRAFLAEHPPGGVVLFKRNVRSAAQLRRLTDAVHELGAGVRPLVALDHEGGRVHRLPRPFTHFPPAAIIGARDDARLAQAVGRAMGSLQESKLRPDPWDKASRTVSAWRWARHISQPGSIRTIFR